jgi:hypothetical protein
MDVNKINPEAIRKAFKFLVEEFGYSVILDKELFHGDRPYACWIEYAGNERRVILSHDYKENFFYFFVIRGLDTKYPNDQDSENIISFWKLFKFFEPSLELREVQPEKQTCAEAALINARLLRQYAPGILQGRKWF